MREKPYSFVWWLKMRDIAYSGRINTSYAVRFTEPATKERDYLLKRRMRYDSLVQFITNRMIDKFGGNE